MFVHVHVLGTYFVLNLGFAASSSSLPEVRTSYSNYAKIHLFSYKLLENETALAAGIYE